MGVINMIKMNKPMAPHMNKNHSDIMRFIYSIDKIILTMTIIVNSSEVSDIQISYKNKQYGLAFCRHCFKEFILIASDWKRMKNAG